MPPPPVASSAPRISASDLPSPGRELIELKRERNAKEREVLELRQAVHEKEMLLLAWQDREADVESRTVDLEERLDRSEREKQFLANERAVVELRLSELEQHSSRAIQDLKRQIGAQTVREAELEGTIQRVNTELRTMSAEVETLNAQLSDREAALVTAERHMSDLADRISRQQAEMQRLNAEIGAVAAQAATAREQMEETQAEVQSLRDHKAELERDLAVERDEKAGARRALEEAKVHIQQARERIRAEERQRAKAMRALEIFLGILRETGYDVSSRKDD
jgi:chromosome segregation ATPase